MRSTLRLFACCIIVALTLLAGSQAATAGRAAADDGASGGGGTTGSLDETDRAIALHELSVADDSGWPPTANTRSIRMIESTAAPGGFLAGGTAPPSRVPYEESEHAVAQNRFASVATPPSSYPY
jgi:hypothetical protein